MHLQGGSGPQPLGSPWAWDGGSSRGPLPWQLPLLTSCLQQLQSLISSPQSHYDHHGNQAMFVPTGWKNLTQDCRGRGGGHQLQDPGSGPARSSGKDISCPDPIPIPCRSQGAAGGVGSSPLSCSSDSLVQSCCAFPKIPHPLCPAVLGQDGSRTWDWSLQQQNTPCRAAPLPAGLYPLPAGLFSPTQVVLCLILHR